MRDTSDSTGNIQIFYSPLLQFSVKIFGDSSLGTSFQSWIMLDSSQWKRPPNTWVIYPTWKWYMSVPQGYKLTGRGDQARTDTVYSLNLRDTTLAQNRILKCAGLSVIGNSDAPPAQNFTMLMQLTDNYLKSAAIDRKQFYFITRFTEQFFGGQFINVFGYSDTTQTVQSCFNFYLPSMVKAPPNICNIGEGSIIDGPFSFTLDTAKSIFDSAGYALISDVRLVIAKKPDNWVWNPSPATVAQYTLMFCLICSGTRHLNIRFRWCKRNINL